MAKKKAEPVITYTEILAIAGEYIRGTVLNLRNNEIAAGTHLSADGKVYVITAVTADCKETFGKPGNSQSLELFSADYKLAD